MGVHLAPSLVRGRAVIDGRWPTRDRASDGWIGDAAHQGRTSDHNPNVRDSVNAIDVDMFGGGTPVHRASIVAGAMVHPATEYVIFWRRIYQRSDQFRPRVYNGINPHDKHAHVSIRQSISAENDPTPWTVWAAFPQWGTLRAGTAGRAERELQAFLNAHGWALAVDGDFGAKTDAAVREFQASRAIGVDGIVGPVTRGKLFA